jgi:hypothetical protein
MKGQRLTNGSIAPMISMIRDTTPLLRISFSVSLLPIVKLRKRRSSMFGLSASYPYSVLSAYGPRNSIGRSTIGIQKVLREFRRARCLCW